MLEYDRIGISDRKALMLIKQMLKKKKIERENMEERDTVICLMNRNKNSKNIKKMTVRLKVNKCNQ